jgi:hypothetical protein
MRNLVITLLLVAGCGDGPGEQSVRGEPTLLGFERRMCNCRDAACATLVTAALARWSKQIPANAPKPDPTESAKIMARYNACMAKANEKP